MFFHYCRYHLIIGMTFDDKCFIFICRSERYMTLLMSYFHNNYCQYYYILLSGKPKLFGDTISENTIIGVCWTRKTCPSYKLI